MANENVIKLWTNGYIVISGANGKQVRIDVQEATVSLSRDLNEIYNAGSSTAAALNPGKERVEFTLKRIFSNDTIFNIYKGRCQFNLVLFNNSSSPGPQNTGDKIMAITGAMLSQENFGTLGNGEAVTEDVQGKALDITLEAKDIAPLINPQCKIE